MTEIAIIGGGAAGFFAAITAAERHPQAKITLIEAAAQPLGKVKISGGGRCLSAVLSPRATGFARRF
jgi:predicted flavoprotein YhiN